jgi:hypothetical protein
MTQSEWSPPSQADRTNPLAIAALVCGVAQFCGLFPAGILAIIFGHKARRRIQQTGEGGDGLALAGLILGYISIAMIAIAIAFAFLASHPQSGG